MASPITSLMIIYSTVYSGADQRKHQSSASLAFVMGIHRWPVNSPHKGPVTRKMFPFDDVIMSTYMNGWIHCQWSQFSTVFIVHTACVVWVQNCFKECRWGGTPEMYSILNRTLCAWSTTDCVVLHPLTHWGRVTHICDSKLTIIGSDNGLPPARRQAIIWTNAAILLIRPLETNFREILIEIYIFSFRKMHLKMSSAKWRPFFSRGRWFKIAP